VENPAVYKNYIQRVFLQFNDLRLNIKRHIPVSGTMRSLERICVELLSNNY